MKKLLCIDGNSILNRQFYGIRYLATKDGFPTNAIFGFVNVILKQMETLSPDYTAVAFDLKAPTFRHRMYDAYKAGRHATPDELLVQFPVAKDICRALGLSVLELEGYEADDILGTLSAMAERSSSEGEKVEAYVLTGDKDSLQLISKNTKVLLATNTDTIVMDEAAFVEKYGISPEYFVDVKALMGDSSDNIPGVAGIGEKTALKLIADANTIDALYENIDGMKLSPSQRAKLSDGRDSAYLSKKLATICREVPLGICLSDIENKGIDTSAARQLFTRYELSGAIKRLGLDREDESSADSKPSEIVYLKTFSELDGEYYAFDMCDGAVYLSDGEKIYSISENTDGISEFLSSHKIICYDCKSLYQRLDGAGISWRECFFDVMLGAYVEDSSFGSYALDRLCAAYLSETPDLSQNAVCYIARLWKIIEEKLEERGELSLLFDIEMPLAAVLCDMENEGIRVDAKGIENYGYELEAVARELEERIYLAAGESFNINSPKQLGEILFEKLMLPTAKKTKTGYSTSAEVLEKLKKYHPIIEDILDYRQVTKLKGTYVDGLLKVIDENGRIHTTFKQTGTATGRLSSADPNLQNIPIRTEAGRRFRRYFVASDSSSVLIDADYSQIELRVLAHMSGDEHMIGAFESGEDIHTATACRVFGVTPESMSAEHRKRAKAINFGILYGMGEFSLSEDLGISRAMARDYIRSYLESYPSIDDYLSKVIADAKRDGYVTTMLGRRRNIPELSASNKNLVAFGERVARNSPIQGSSADIIKIAMVNADRRLKKMSVEAKILLQVHDELLIESPKECAEEVMAILKEEMENAVKLAVPLLVEAKMGANWHECH